MPLTCLQDFLNVFFPFFSLEIVRAVAVFCVYFPCKLLLLFLAFFNTLLATNLNGSHVTCLQCYDNFKHFMLVNPSWILVAFP